MYMDDKWHVIYGESGYNQQMYLNVPFNGSNLDSAQSAFKQAIATGRVTVERMYMEVKLYWAVVDFKRKMRVR